MKKYFILLMIGISLLLPSCKKDVLKGISEGIGSDSVTQYIKDTGTWLYKNEEDLGKDAKSVKEKEYFEFGSKLTLIKTKKLGEKEFAKVQLPDKTEYWVIKDSLTSKFVTINQTDVVCYRQPDPDYATSVKLQPGDFGFFVKEMDSWIYVDFYAYRPLKEGGEKKWVGKCWIKEGYTDDLNSAKQAFYLYQAYSIMIKDKNSNAAINTLNKGLEATQGKDTVVSNVIKDYMDELQGQNQ